MLAELNAGNQGRRRYLTLRSVLKRRQAMSKELDYCLSFGISPPIERTIKALCEERDRYKDALERIKLPEDAWAAIIIAHEALEEK